jgi:amidophosphoribosyltransferase
MLKYIKKEKFRKINLPAVLSAIEQDTDNTVFLIFNTAETSFFGLVEAAQDFLNQRKKNYILENRMI